MIHNRFTSIRHHQPLLNKVFSFIHLLGWTIQITHIHLLVLVLIQVYLVIITLSVNHT